jgi:uncharacterized protein YbaP (TraB family)
MIRKILTATFIALFFYLSANAQLLWKVSGNGLSKPSYLFGTHHLIGKEQIKDFDKILILSGQADAVVGEMDMTDMVSIQAKIMQAAVMPGKNIKDMISAADYTLVDTGLKQIMGTGLDQLGTYKPIMLQTIFVGLVYLRSQNLTKQPEAIDVLFQKNAKDNHKQVVGLETIEQQAAILFNFLSLNRQAEILVKTVKEKQKQINLIKRMNEYYLAGDLKRLFELDNEDDDLTTAEKKPLYENRNADWMKQIPALLTKQSCFIAVGCMHLVGETGLIEQLNKAGYTVEGIVNL